LAQVFRLIVHVHANLIDIMFLAAMSTAIASEGSPERVPTQSVESFSADVRNLLDAAQQGVEVYLNVYDVSHSDALHNVNDVLASTYSPVKFGGIFHVGVEIFNAEWNYGYSKRGSGVNWVVPRNDRQHRFKQQVRLPNSLLTPDQIDEVITRLHKDYCGTKYNVIENNCCHFAEDLCQRLGVGSIPAWVGRAGNICHSLQKISRVLSLEAMPVDWLASCNSQSRHDTPDQHTFTKMDQRRVCII